MKLQDILPALPHMMNGATILNARSRTYLATYPNILKIAARRSNDRRADFYQLALFAYGWMPRVLRIEEAVLPTAIEALQKAESVTHWRDLDIDVLGALEKCLSSMVGASKILHFSNPRVFPIWDSKVEAFRCGARAVQQQWMTSNRYLEYVAEVSSIRAEHGFGVFYENFQCAFAKLLGRHGIDSYDVSEVRSIEVCAFEMSSSGRQ
jgi:hypothetical protein